MLRFGILSLEEFRPAPPGASRRRHAISVEHVSLQLLRTGLPASPAERTLFESVIRYLQFGGVYRTTYRARLGDVDSVVNGLLTDRHQPECPLEVHDWAASDALTSVEWAKSLFQFFPKATLIASDVTLFLVEATRQDGSTFVLAPDGRAVQYIRRPFVIRLDPPERWLTLINRIIGRRVLARFHARPLTIPRDWLASNDQTLAGASAAFKKIPLVHPDARLFARSEPRFSIRQHSVFDPLERPVDVVRTMNVLNPIYFSATRRLEGARSVWKSLKVGGCWIVGRTSEDKDARNDVSIVERTEDGFRLLARVGGGSEIEPLAMGAAMRT